MTRAASGREGAQTGAITFVQRFGGSLNLHVHFHTVAVDGVFEREGERVRFQEAAPPRPGELSELCRRMAERTHRWLKRHGDLDERPAEERPSEVEERAALEACTQLALAGGVFLGRPFTPPETSDAALERKE